MHKFSENLFQNAMDLNETIVFEYDATEDIISFSDNIKKYIPMPLRVSSFVEKMDYLGKIYERDIQKAISFFTSVSEKDKVRLEYVRFLDFAGEFCWYQLKGRTETDSKGRLATVYGTLAYIDDETKHRQEEMSASHDPLTHLLTKEAFINGVDTYISEMPKDVIPNLMVIDLDDFTDWLSIYSEVSGEGVLIEIARILKRAFRGSDLIAYTGNDQFAVMMKGVKAANILLERAAYIRQTVKEVWGDFENNGVLTVSIGVAAMHGVEANSDRLYARALAALTDAKNSGKDTYVLYNGDNERLDTSINPILNSKEMEMIRNILDPMCTWAYAVDDNYQLLYRNEILSDRLNNSSIGMCYKQNKGYSEPCPDCPIAKMSDKNSSFDGNVYSTSLRTSVPMRANRIVMRNGKSVFLLASVKENIESQIATMTESEERIRDSLIEMQDVIWDVNVTKNLCVRIKEQRVKSFIDVRIANYNSLRSNFMENVVHADDAAKFSECTDPKHIKQAVLAGQHIVNREVRLLNLMGEYEWYGINTYIQNPEVELASDDGGLTYNLEKDDLHVMIACFDINEYKKHSIEELETHIKYKIMYEKSHILKDMAMSYERYENVNDMIGILVYEYTVATGEYYLCSNFEDVFEIDKKNLKDEWTLIDSFKCHPDDEAAFNEFKENAKTATAVQKITVRLYNKFQVPVWYTIVLQTLRGLNNSPVRYLGTLQNVNTEMKIKAEMAYRADYDSLTGLYNAETFYRKASEIIHLKPELKFVIMSIDVERFRLINDRYGIDAGNRSLMSLGKALRDTAPVDSVAKRYQADVFSVLLPYESDQDLIEYMTRLSGIMRDTKILPMPITLTYGIYKIVDRNIPIRLMCDRARAVKRQIKNNALINYAVYDDVIRLRLREQAEIEEEMQNALANKEFVMYLQPQIDIATGKLIGAEALVRWQHPIKGVMVPAQFLNLFESNGFITKMDIYMWEEACKYLARLKSRDTMIPVSVNISRVHIGNTNLCSILLNLVKKYDIEPKYLELEITENLFMEDVGELFSEMRLLKEAGFKILMDDFGSGYSSLNMLRNAPIDALKIDRFFLDEIMATDRGKIIVESSVRMAKQLGLAVVAEGVETKEQLDFLEKIECDVAQGYYYSRPIPPEDFERFMSNYL